MAPQCPGLHLAQEERVEAGSLPETLTRKLKVSLPLPLGKVHKDCIAALLEVASVPNALTILLFHVRYKASWYFGSPNNFKKDC